MNQQNRLISALVFMVFINWPVVAKDAVSEDPNTSIPPAAATSKNKHRNELSQIFINKTYGPVIATLSSDPSEAKILMDLLTERHEALKDVDEVVLSQKNWKENDRKAARKAAASKAEAEIKGHLDGKRQEKLDLMIESQYELSQLANGNAKSLAAAGYPLSPAQHLALAVIMHNSYDPDRNPSAAKRDTLEVNEWGLTKLDEEFLGRLVDVLTVEQCALVRNSLVFTNRSSK